MSHSGIIIIELYLLLNRVSKLVLHELDYQLVLDYFNGKYYYFHLKSSSIDSFRTNVIHSDFRRANVASSGDRSGQE